MREICEKMRIARGDVNNTHLLCITKPHYVSVPTITCNLSLILTEAQPIIIVFLNKGREWIKERLQVMVGYNQTKKHIS